MSDIPIKFFFDVVDDTLRDGSGNGITTNELFPSARLGQKFWFNVQLTESGIVTKYGGLTLGSSAEVIVDNDYLNPSPIFGLPGDSGGNWTVSAGAEYYYNGDEVTASPAKVFLNDILATEGVLGSLAASEWVWDTGSSRLVVRLADDTDPDTKADDWVTYKIVITDDTDPFIYVDSDTFNQALSWYDTVTETYRNPVITDGELSFFINANTSDFYTRLDNKKWKVETTMQIQMIAPVSAQLYKLFEFQFVCKNLYIGDGFSLEVVGANVYTKAETIAKFVQQDLTEYTVMVTPAGTDTIFSRQGGVSKVMTLTQVATFIADTGAEETLSNGGSTAIIIGDKTVYRAFMLFFTIDDGATYHTYSYRVIYNGVDTTDDGGNEFVSGTPISGLAISFDISGNNLNMLVNNTSGGALKLVWLNVNKLILST